MAPPPIRVLTGLRLPSSTPAGQLAIRRGTANADGSFPVTVEAVTGGGVTAHSALTGLTTGDDHTQYVRVVPASTARNTVAPTAAGVVPLTLQLPAGSSSHAIDLVNGGGTNVGSLTAGGDWTVYNDVVAGHNVSAGNAFYFPNSSLLMYATAADDTGNAYTFTDSGGTAFRQIKARSLRLYQTTSASPIIGLDAASSVQQRRAAEISVTFATATDASRKGRIVLSATDFAATREGIRIETSGMAPLLGFFGTAAVVQQSAGTTATDAASVITLANALRSSLINLGLVA